MTTNWRMPEPQVPDPLAGPSLRWAILGTGWIANRFVESLQQHTSQQIVAVGSRTAERAQEFAAAHGMAKAYGSYEELVHADVDVVYVATGHLEHLAHASLALEAGKPVLVEKPMTPRATDTRALVALAREKGLFAMEAVWSLALPRYSVIRQVLESGMLGEIHEVYANLGERLIDHHRAMDQTQGGGVMNDIGSYTMMFASEVLSGLKVRAAHGTRGRGSVAHGASVGTSADASAAIAQFHALLGNEVGQMATVSASMFGDTPTTAYIAGSEATLELEAPFYQPGPVTVRFHGGEVLRYVEPALAHTQLFWEALEVARCIHEGLTESPLRTLDRTLETVVLMEQARDLMGDLLS